MLLQFVEASYSQRRFKDMQIRIQVMNLRQGSADITFYGVSAATCSKHNTKLDTAVVTLIMKQSNKC